MDITTQPASDLIDQLLANREFIDALKRRVAPIKWVSKEIFADITGVSLNTLKNRRSVWTEGLVYYQPESSSEYVYSVPGYYQWLDEQAAKDFPLASKSVMAQSVSTSSTIMANGASSPSRTRRRRRALKQLPKQEGC